MLATSSGPSRRATGASKSAEVEALVAGSVETYGRLDCACNNAGIEGKVAPIVEQSAANFDQIMSINAKGVFPCLKYEIAQMLKNAGGAIVNVACYSACNFDPLNWGIGVQF